MYIYILTKKILLYLLVFLFIYWYFYLFIMDEEPLYLWISWKYTFYLFIYLFIYLLTYLLYFTLLYFTLLTYLLTISVIDVCLNWLNWFCPLPLILVRATIRILYSWLCYFSVTILQCYTLSTTARTMNKQKLALVSPSFVAADSKYSSKAQLTRKTSK